MQKCNFIDGVAFVVMMLSASAMDSKNPVISGSICLLSALMLYRESKKGLPEKEEINSKVREMGCVKMFYPIENRMVVDSEWEDDFEDKHLPVCECCEEKIKQFRALHILSGRKRVWICDRCIEDMKEVTGF